MPENCAAIVIAAKHHELFKVKDTRGTTKTVGALRCKFDFRTNDWNNSAKTAMFCNGNVVLHPKLIDDAIAMPLDVENECAVPAEVLDDTLPYSIGVWGVTNSGLRIVSNWLIFNAQIGCYTDGNAPADPEPTLYEQILSIADNAARAAQDLINRANNGEFDGETPYIGENGNWWVAELDTSVRAHGKSAYEVACAHGFEGTSTEWLASLVGATGADGKSAYEVALDGGFKGTQQEWLASLVGEAGVNGKSAYEIAKEHGFNGTEHEWLNSLVGKDGTPGKDGINGKSAYELAKDNGFAGTEQEWLQSLIGKDGGIGPAGANGKSAYELAVDNGFEGTEQEWLESLVGKDGIIGVDGKSAYDIAKEQGFEGTEAEWIESLTGADGVGVAELSYNDENELIVTMTDGTEKNVGKVRVDIDALREIFAAKEDVKQPDWNQSDNSQVDYIKNKPNLGQVASLNEIGKTNLSAEVQETLDKTGTIESTANEAKASVTELENYVKTKASSIDLSAFESDGTIVETFADGSTKTTTMEFDANGNPIKITDAEGNVTVLTWGG